MIWGSQYRQSEYSFIASRRRLLEMIAALSMRPAGVSFGTRHRHRPSRSPGAMADGEIPLFGDIRAAPRVGRTDFNSGPGFHSARPGSAAPLRSKPGRVWRFRLINVGE
jgi:hypothetical protein